LQYAPQSKSASQIRLKRGFGNIQDILLVHESLPWILGLFYVVLICIAVPVTFSKNIVGMYLILVLVILPLLYLYYIFNHKKYKKDTVKKQVKESKKVETPVSTTADEKSSGMDSFKRYEKEISNLKVVFNVKEKVVRELIEKRFEPPQITYDKFMSSIDNCHKLFYAQSDAASNIIDLAVEDTPRVQDEIEGKIDAMKKIIDQIEDLTNELVINISSSGESTDEVKNLLDDMENLIESVKDY
jgi:Ca2+/Na+ antiporter